LRFQFRKVNNCLLLMVALAFASGTISRAQTATDASSAQTASQYATSDTETKVKPGAEVENNEFRHAGPVRAIASVLHVSTETAAQIFEDVNSAILIGLILFFAIKVLRKALRDRTATIQKQLIDARSATEIAKEQLAAVEAKLATLGKDIDAIRQQTERDILEDERRIKQSLEEEKDRIVKAAEQEIDSAGAAAQRDLKRFAAELSIDRAAARIQLNAASDRTIVERFGKDLVGQFGKGDRN
jgi:F-type H+-transporting ATPase subunit b